MKQVLFGDLEDGDIFYAKHQHFRKVTEVKEYNALALNLDMYSSARKFPACMPVEKLYKQVP